ncbi:MAG: zinc-ribbon domain-containing protein [Ruminococcus sp.]
MVKIIIGQNDLFTTNPEFKLEWDFDKNEISAESVTAGSHKKVWWKCKKGHSWNAEIKSRVNGADCPYCSGRLAIVGVNDLATLFPELVKQWNFEKIKNYHPIMLKHEAILRYGGNVRKDMNGKLR